MENKNFTFGWNLLLLLMPVLLIIYAIHNYNYATEIKENNFVKDCLEKINFKIVDKYKEVHRNGTYYYLNVENTVIALDVSEKIFEKAITGNIITREICETGIKTKNN